MCLRSYLKITAEPIPPRSLCMTHRLQEKLQELLYGLQEELQEIYDTAVKVFYTMGCGVRLNRSGARRQPVLQFLSYEWH